MNRSRRRRRALAFGAAAAACAALAAASVGGRPPDPAAALGPLRDVVVTRLPLAAGHRIDRRAAERELEVRRVPGRFVPAGALSSLAQAIGRAPTTALPAGAYVEASSFTDRARARRPDPRVGAHRRPVQITVTGAEPLAGSRPGTRVDVVVTGEQRPGGAAGATYVAAAGVTLLALEPAGGGQAPQDVVPGPGSGGWLATLALTRAQALRLIHAQSFAREVRLIGG